MNAFLIAITLNYFNTKDRATRSEFIIFVIVDLILWFITLSDSITSTWKEIDVLLVALHLYLLVPSWTLSMRRLNDIGASNLFVLAYFVIGPILGIPLSFIPSQSQNNDRD